MAKAITKFDKELNKECLRLSKPKIEIKAKSIRLSLEDTLREIIREKLEQVRRYEVAAKCWNGLVENGWNINYFPNLEGEMKWQVVKFAVNSVLGWEVIATGEIPEQALFRALSLKDKNI
jgi:hypothetical protein